MTPELLATGVFSLLTVGSLAASIVMAREGNRNWGWFLFFAWIGLMCIGKVAGTV